MEDVKIGDFVRFSGKEGRFGQVKHVGGTSLVLELLETVDKAKNQHVHWLVPEEVVQTQKRVEIPTSRITEKANVLNLSAFLDKYYDFNSKTFDTENIILSGDILMRFSNQLLHFRVHGQGDNGGRKSHGPLSLSGKGHGPRRTGPVQKLQAGVSFEMLPAAEGRVQLRRQDRSSRAQKAVLNHRFRR
jgi:hypothetical protein